MAEGNTRKQVEETSRKWNLNLSPEELDEYADVLQESLTSMRSVTQDDTVKPEVKYPRDPGYRPPPEENPYNAWYYKTSIHGAKSGKLSGKRVAIKDSVCVAGVPMMAGSALMEGYVPEIDATVVTRILDAGGLVAGKAVCEDLCFSADSCTSATGHVTNVNDVTRSSGGSSSGCASLIRCGEVDMAIGGDQGGSIRIPAAWSGIVGLKPTWGLVPHTGAIGLAYSFDHVGPMATNVHDCALLLEVIAGPDGLDSRQSPDTKVPGYSSKLCAGVVGMKLCLVKEAFAASDPQIDTKVRAAVNSLQEQGADVEEVSVPHFNKVNTGFVAACDLATFQTVFQHGLQTPMCGGYQDLQMFDWAQRRLPQTLSQLSVAHKIMCMIGESLEVEERARLISYGQNVISLLRQEYDTLLTQYDALLMPTVTMVAQKFPEKGASVKELLQHYIRMTTITEQSNMTQHPALSVPCGDIDGLPVGLMIVGRHYDEQTVLNVGYTYESLCSPSGGLHGRGQSA